MRFRTVLLLSGTLATLLLPVVLQLAWRAGRFEVFDGRQEFKVANVFAGVVAAGFLLAACAALQFALRRIGDVTLWRALCLAIGAAWFAALPLNGYAGDMATWLKFAHHPFIMASEPLGRWTHWIAYQFLALPGVASGQAALALASVCSGTFATWAVLHWGPRALPHTPIVVLLAALWLHPFALFFHAYPETTHLSYALLLAALLAGIHHLKSTPDRPPWIPGGLFAIAVFGHGAACFATGAQAFLIARWYWLNRKQRPLTRVVLLCVQPFVLLAMTILVCKLAAAVDPVMFVVGNIDGGQDGTPWIAFSQSGKSILQYVFLEPRYVREITGLILISGLGLAMLPWAFSRPNPATGFLASALAGLLLLTFFWNADLGIMIDLDLLSFFALPLGLLVLASADDAQLASRTRVMLILAPSAMHFAAVTSGLLRMPFVG